jgi:hypothetical protein
LDRAPLGGEERRAKECLEVAGDRDRVPHEHRKQAPPTQNEGQALRPEKRAP